MGFLKSLYSKMSQSLNGDSNKVSTSRLQSYLIILPILVMIATFLIIELWSFVHAIQHGLPYRLSNEIIVVFSLVLGHHLSILFSRNKPSSISEIKSEISNINGDPGSNVTNTLTTNQ
jgi:hypothetical protein